MDSNNMYQNQPQGQDTDNNQNGNPNNNLNGNPNVNPNGYYQSTYIQGDNSQNTYTNPNPNPNANPNANPGYQYNPYNNGYQPAYQPMQTDLEEPVSMGEWLITLLIMIVPCVNIIMVFVWAFSSDTKKSKSNYFKAALIFAAIYIVVCLLFAVVLGNALAAEFMRY